MPNQENPTVKTSLSKSSYIKGLQCPKSLWLFNNRQDLKLPTDNKTKAKFETGNEITKLARMYFPEGTKAVDDYFDIQKATSSTKELISKNHSIIFEATAIIDADGSHARIDILRKNIDSGGWDLIEVKGSNIIKENHLNDLSFQYHIFSKAGYDIDKCLLMLVDNSCVLQGEIDPNHLFKFHQIQTSPNHNQSNPDISCNSEHQVTMSKKCQNNEDDFY